MAVGRTPHTDDLGLESVGLKPGTAITVDDRMRVTIPARPAWLYAIGDVNGRALLTQAAKYQRGGRGGQHHEPASHRRLG